MALTPWQQGILNQSRANGGQGTVQEMVQLAGLELNPENFERVRKILAEAGETATADTVSENQARLAREAGAGNKPLTDYQQQQYLMAQRRGETSQEIAQRFNGYGVPVKGSEVDDILAGAGLKLSGDRPFTAGGNTPTEPAATPQPPEFNGGMPGRQPSGLGMYGGFNIINAGLPTQGDAIPRLPGMRDIFRQARRRSGQSGQDYKGKTDTILTSGRGVLGAALLKPKVLTGS